MLGSGVSRHTPGMPSRRCFDFGKGRCNRGIKCRYSHDTTTAATNLSRITKPQPHEEIETESLCRKWTNMIPRPNINKARIQTPLDIKLFFQIGWELIESKDAGTRQHVITNLGAESGLAIIKNLADIMEVNQNENSIITIFNDGTLPFYRIVSQADVLSSLILETPVHAIYTFLFGPGGRRGLSLFRSTATVLSTMVMNNYATDENACVGAISSSLAVLDRMIELNQSAQVISDFNVIVETMSACIPQGLKEPNAPQSLTRLRRRLNIGSSLPLAPTRSIPQNTIPAFFELCQDLPGDLSINGPRHDNDHADIANIQILPTAQEIGSTRQDYLPLTDATHHHLSGPAGLLDRQFRLLREDNVGQLRNAVREEVARLKHSNPHVPTVRNGEQGVRRIIYQNVRITRICVDRRKGFQVVTRFDQPPQINGKNINQREEWWKGSKLLQVDSLVCFASSTGEIIFFTVSDPLLPTHRRKDSNTCGGADTEASDGGPSLFRQASYASVLLSLAEYDREKATWIGSRIDSHAETRQSLVEFPGILLSSFQPTLQVLQQMSKSLDLPFAEIIAPNSHTPAVAVQPPAYATRLGFKFNLDILAGVPLTLTPGKIFDYDKLESGTTLDRAQQVSVINALQTELALIQGPPGTGKSYTGVAIIKTLLHNRDAANLGPIICVCYTNHALDQLLEHLLKDDVKQIIRLGSRSKSDTLQNLTLRQVAQDMASTRTEQYERRGRNRQLNAILQEIEDTLFYLNNAKSWASIHAHLKRTASRHFIELFGNGVDEEGFQEVHGRKFRVVDSWLRGAPKQLTASRPLVQLLDTSLREMSKSERSMLHKYWTGQRTAQLNDDLVHAMDSYYDCKSTLDKCNSEIDLRCLLEARIIGVTTSGLARNFELLRRVQAKVVICEEAGEVLEAHTLTAFLPGIEHAILIGDHDQLRPQINDYELQHDNPRGKKYSLDISLFERLVKPDMGSSHVPLSTLNIQRRMHPSISELIRVTLYKDLQDHHSVLEYPEVNGMRDRLYWLDHKEKEDPRPPQAVSLSRTNTFEVDMIAALVSHLVRQGTYASEDIAVITPYLGQLQKIKNRLANSFEIVVGDRDLEELEATGLEAESDVSIKGQVQVQKRTLLNALRLATVDNFQGEEAKVVVISLVRSNDQQKCGFLKTSNRINVLLSRAQHGMYIIGNSDTSRPIPMWAEVLSILERSNSIGPRLSLCCPRHKEVRIEVSAPDDFIRFSPEGGCAQRCSSRFTCGHACPNMCHSASLHDAVRCLERCQRTKKGCDHECPRPCGDLCEQKCKVVLFEIPLPCGHIAKQLSCHEAQRPHEVRCHVEMEQIMKDCKHKIIVRCHELPLDVNYPCSATCKSALHCGHNCNHTCKDCNIRIDGKIVETKHGDCETQCGRPYTTCSHSCIARCHGDEPCSLCNKLCEVSCSHSKCNKLCNEPCAPCAENCSFYCPHRGKCLLPCAVPCDLLPCSERCAKILGCGHRCPSVCGELCPSVHYCQTCADPTIKEMEVDYIMSTTFEDIKLDEEPCIVPSCGHILTIESMDGHMSMLDFYTIDSEGSIIGLKNTAEPFSASGMKSCPKCRGPLRNINRYSRIVRRALIDQATKKFIIWANMGFIPLARKMQAIEAELREKPTGNLIASNNELPKVDVLGTFQLKGIRDEQFSQIVAFTVRNGRYKTVIELRRAIKKFLQQVDEKEQPFGRIYDLVQDSRRHRGIDVDFNADVDILQVRNRLLTTVLLIRCDYTILLNFLNDLKDETEAEVSAIHVDLAKNRKECEDLIVESCSRDQPGTAVEGHLYWARYVAVEHSFARPGPQMTELLNEATEHLRLARRVCDRHPGQTAGIRKEIMDVKKMLRGSTFYMPVSNEEKAAVYAAMAHDFRGTGHWYYCQNGHPFTVGDCGMPMETSRCPQCGSQVGGHNHQPVDGVTHAADMDRDFGRLAI